MTMFVGLDVGGKRTAVSVIDAAGKIVWRGMVDTHPEMIYSDLKQFSGKFSKVRLEAGLFTPHLFRSPDGVTGRRGAEWSSPRMMV